MSIVKRQERKLNMSNTGYYIVTHYYSMNRKETDIYLKTNVSKIELEDFLIKIQFLFEDLVDNGNDFSKSEYIPFIEKYYKGQIEVVEGVSENNSFVQEIDLHLAREIRCGIEYQNFSERVDKPIFKTDEFISMIKTIKI